MRTLLALCLLSISILTYAQTPKQSLSLIEQEKMLSIMEIMKYDYENFIDTPPSSKKRELAQKVKIETERFESLYPTSKQLPAVLELRKEVRIYLDSLK